MLQGDVVRSHAVVSPNGNWLAYSSDQSGQVEIYMQPYPGPGRTVQVSSGGGGAVIWSHDGSELFYRNGTRMMAVSVNADGTIGVPSELFDRVYFSGATPSNPRMYDVARDGRFLMLKDEETANQIVLVQNWSQELTERVPVN